MCNNCAYFTFISLVYTPGPSFLFMFLSQQRSFDAPPPPLAAFGVSTLPPGGVCDAHVRREERHRGAAWLVRAGASAGRDTSRPA